MNKRLVLLVVAGALLVGGFFAFRKFRSHSHEMMNTSARGMKKKDVYQCSMHPQIVSDKPEDCPICGMKLTKVEDESSASSTGTGARKILFYRHPMRPDVTSPTPAKDEMGMDYIPVYSDEMATGEPSIPGHAPFKLSTARQQLIGVKTSTVERKDLAIEIRAVGKIAYDPDLYNAIVEYREALKAKEKIKDSPLPEAHERAEALIKGASLRLRLMGISEDQIQSTLMDDPDPVNLLLPGKNVWVYAQVYEYEADLVRAGQEVVVTVPSQPGRTYKGKVTAIDPVLNAATRTVRVRALISTPQARLKPESFVQVKIHVSLGRNLGVPEDAVLDTGEHQIVFVKKGDGDFEPRSIEIGRVAQGFYEVLSGLKEGEEVVTSANFLIDSESRFRAAVQAFSSKEQAGHSH